MKTLVERLREEADDTHKNWYRVASDEQREICRALTIEAANRIAYLESLFPLDTDENVIAAKTAMVTAIAALEHSEAETKPPPGFCPECRMTGGHKLRCSKAETACTREGHVWVEVGPSEAPWQKCDECGITKETACDCETLDARGPRGDSEIFCPKCGKVFRESETKGDGGDV